MANNLNADLWDTLVTTATQPTDPAFTNPDIEVPFYDPEIGLIQESRAARRVSEGPRIWQRVYAARR
jgi:hypothetical protein